MGNTEKSVKILRNMKKRSKIHVTRVPERKARTYKKEKIFKDLIV